MVIPKYKSMLTALSLKPFSLPWKPWGHSGGTGQGILTALPQTSRCKLSSENRLSYFTLFNFLYN